jgi:hypothetical protein
MLGPAKPRRLDESIAVSLEELVPATHFYRHLEAKLDLGFVRGWTRVLHAERGRSSISPIVPAASSSLAQLSRHLWSLPKVPNGYRPSQRQCRLRREPLSLAHTHRSLPASFSAPDVISLSTNSPASTRYPATTWRCDASGYVIAATVGCASTRWGWLQQSRSLTVALLRSGPLFVRCLAGKTRQCSSRTQSV